MSEQTLKELLKTPFRHAKAFKSIDDCDGNALVLLSQRITFWDNKELEYELKSFICASLNEKWERDFVEPLRWIVIMPTESNDGYFICPKCEKESGIFWCGESVDDIEDLPNYCPYCGIRLYPPEEKT